MVSHSSHSSSSRTAAAFVLDTAPAIALIVLVIVLGIGLFVLSIMYIKTREGKKRLEALLHETATTLASPADSEVTMREEEIGGLGEGDVELGALGRRNAVPDISAVV